MILTIDIGNSYTKIALFEGNALKERILVHKSESRRLWEIVDRKCVERIAISSVGRADAIEKEAEESGLEIVRLTRETKLPFENGYSTPETLGLDRIAGMIGAWAKCLGERDFLVMDLGTCNTYDSVIEGKFVGGNIAPGIEMRLRAMHDYTAKLPMINISESGAGELTGINGKSTREAMVCGAMLGMADEVNGHIRRFKQLAPNGLCILTGGYGELMVGKTDEPVEYDPMLVPEGLNFIARN